MINAWFYSGRLIHGRPKAFRRTVRCGDRLGPWPVGPHSGAEQLSGVVTAIRVERYAEAVSPPPTPARKIVLVCRLEDSEVVEVILDACTNSVEDQKMLAAHGAAASAEELR